MLQKTSDKNTSSYFQHW